MQYEDRLDKMPEPTIFHRVLVIMAIPMVIMALYLTFIYTPVERQMGLVQKVFYFHVGSAWNAFFAFFIVGLFSVLYLIKRKRIYDMIAKTSAEIGVVFTAIVLTTGPIWARSAWNTWWTWEPRLTTTLILFFIYVAYIAIRHLELEWEKKARLSSVLGIIGALMVPIVYMSIYWWESNLHPVIGEDIDGSKASALEPSMLFTLIFTVFTMTLIYGIFMQKGLYVEKLQYHVSKLKTKANERMMG